MDVELKFKIKKLPRTVNERGEVIRPCEWLVFMGDSLIYHDKDYNECLKLATYVVDTYSDPTDYLAGDRGKSVQRFDILMLLIGLSGFAIFAVLGYYLLAAVFVPLIVIAGRGLLLQDYYHLDRRVFSKIVHKIRG